MDSAPLNQRLLGTGARFDQLHTPALLVDWDIIKANSATMKQHCLRQRVSLRPHTKTHRSLKFARFQMEEGAIGVCTATLGEAETMVAGGISNVLITSPVIASIDIARLRQLQDRADGLMVVVDSLENAKGLEHDFATASMPLDVLLDLDPGMHRTGVVSIEDATEMGSYLANSNVLRFSGVQMYAGNLMHVRSKSERTHKARAVMDKLESVCGRLQSQGIECELRTGGGTGTFDIDPDMGVLTELQAGSYLFMDRQYCEVEGLPFEPSLFVATRVVSANTPGLATVDAGLKSLATDADPPIVVAEPDVDVEFFFMGDEHGGLRFDPQHRHIGVGDAFKLLTPHCDPTFNLYDHVHVFQNGVLNQIVAVDARGRSA